MFQQTFHLAASCCFRLKKAPLRAKLDKHESEAKKMVYACDNCHFLFSRVSPIDRCPDCGKERIRPATPEETEEFEKRKSYDFWKE